MNLRKSKAFTDYLNTVERNRSNFYDNEIFESDTWAAKNDGDDEYDDGGTPFHNKIE